MDRSHIDYALICGLPVFKKWAVNETYERPDGYLDNESHVLLARDSDVTIAESILEYRREFAEERNSLPNWNAFHPLCALLIRPTWEPSIRWCSEFRSTLASGKESAKSSRGMTT